MLDFTTPKVMGIINLNPNSFAEINRCSSIDEVLYCAEAAVTHGADILDIGAEATNPGMNNPVETLQAELDYLLPAVTALRSRFDIPLSVDTSKAEVIRACVAAGVNLINDTRALREEGALATVAELQVPVCLMHMSYPYGKPAQVEPVSDMFTEVKNFLQQRIQECLQAGITRDNIIIDPGFGAGNFGKDTQQNLQLLNRLAEFKELGYPLLVGFSRKTFIGDLLDLPVTERLPGSLATAVIAIMQGANIVRVHDVKATVEAVHIATAVINLD